MPKGVVNRGDSFRRRRSRSNSLAPTVQYESSSGDVIKNRPAANNGTGATSIGDNNLASTSASLAAVATSTACTDQRPHHHHHHHSDVRTYRVAIIGAHGVGKSALVGQFMSSECINAYDRVRNGKRLPQFAYENQPCPLTTIHLTVVDRLKREKKIDTLSTKKENDRYK